MLEVDIFADHRFDTWVLLTVSGRIDLNAWEYKQELPDGTETFVTGLNSCYSLFNHSCDPNVEWFRDDVTGRIVFRALEDIEIGEEMFSSYLSDQQLEQSTEKRLETLKSWMGDGPHFCTRCFPELVDNRDVEMTDA
jgi:fructose-1,6-bisphosphatase